jgi:hypothetical protein
MERSERYRMLAQLMFGAQLVFATQQAQRCYADGLWTKLYDQAVDAYVEGRPPNLGGPPSSPRPGAPPPVTPFPVMPEPKTDQ